jgi:hypothetical protein
MAIYRFTQDMSVGQFYYPAGSIASTSDVGGTLPSNFIPSAACDPQDAAAIAAFLAAGPQNPVLSRPQFSGVPVAQAQYKWTATPVPTNPTTWLWQLVGPSGNVGQPVFAAPPSK